MAASASGLIKGDSAGFRVVSAAMERYGRFSPRSTLPASPDQVRAARRRVVVLQAAGATRTAVAQAAGVNSSTITRLMRGEIALTRGTARAVAAARPRFSGF